MKQMYSNCKIFFKCSVLTSNACTKANDPKVKNVPEIISMAHVIS